jgi:uncharacterized protein (DUF952 family)
MATTYHLVPRELWDAHEGEDYEPFSLREEGFIHCTDGMDNLAETGNKHYRNDPRPFYVLTVDLGKLKSKWQYDDPAHIYPHIYGPLNREAVVKVQEMPRNGDGSFIPMSDEFKPEVDSLSLKRKLWLSLTRTSIC